MPPTTPAAKGVSVHGGADHSHGLGGDQRVRNGWAAGRVTANGGNMTVRGEPSTPWPPSRWSWRRRADAGRRPPSPSCASGPWGAKGEVVQQLLPAFERAHPDVRVRVQQIPWSAAHEKLLTAFVGGAMPDVFQAGSTWMPELVALGALASLGPCPTTPVATSSPASPPRIASTAAPGRPPWYVDTRLLFYRSDRLARRRLGRPADRLGRLATGAGRSETARRTRPLRPPPAPRASGSRR